MKFERTDTHTSQNIEFYMNIFTQLLRMWLLIDKSLAVSFLIIEFVSSLDEIFQNVESFILFNFFCLQKREFYDYDEHIHPRLK